MHSILNSFYVMIKRGEVLYFLNRKGVEFYDFHEQQRIARNANS